MKKTINFLVMTVVIWGALFVFSSIVSKTSFVNVLSEFDIVMNLTGFSVTISTIIYCKNTIIDKTK